MKTPPSITKATNGRNLIVFDGICVLCNAWVNFTLRFDKHEAFHFVIAQSDLGEEIYETLGLKSSDYDSFIVVVQGQLFTKLDGVFALFSALGYPWKLLSIGAILPLPVKNWMYDLVAKNRYRLFGKRDTCMLPTPEIKRRFL